MVDIFSAGKCYGVKTSIMRSIASIIEVKRAGSTIDINTSITTLVSNRTPNPT